MSLHWHATAYEKSPAPPLVLCTTSTKKNAHLSARAFVEAALDKVAQENNFEPDQVWFASDEERYSCFWPEGSTQIAHQLEVEINMCHEPH